MDTRISDCGTSFGWKDFDVARVSKKYIFGCPVKGCRAELARAEKAIPVCHEHGLRLHTNTFVYFNGFDPARRRSAMLRNLEVGREYAERHILGSSEKAETHRLGNEMSEDALSWNVFVGLSNAGLLKQTTEWLIGRTIGSAPDLYMWGRRIDLSGDRCDRFDPLYATRDALEKDIRRFRTEPDIMLVVRGELVVCIEAKFGSPNTLTQGRIGKPGEKPTDVPGLLARYLDPASARTRASVLREAIGPKLYGQLFRNVIFASEMAANTDWHVVNLVSGTVDVDPTDHVRGYLSPDSRHRFTLRTWEGLYKHMISEDARARSVGDYMRSKSARFRQAFNL